MFAQHYHGADAGEIKQEDGDKACFACYNRRKVSL